VAAGGVILSSGGPMKNGPISVKIGPIFGSKSINLKCYECFDKWLRSYTIVNGTYTKIQDTYLVLLEGADRVWFVLLEGLDMMRIGCT